MKKKAAEYKKHQMAMHDVIVRLAPGEKVASGKNELETQLAGPSWLNSPELAKLLCESGELEPRENEYKVLRDQGIPQYRVTQKMIQKWSGRTSEA